MKDKYWEKKSKFKQKTSSFSDDYRHILDAMTQLKTDIIQEYEAGSKSS